MLESLVATILNRTLGTYVENFDPKQLNIGIWNGDVKLHDLKLKQESLDKLELPIELKYGHLSSLTLQIPWSNLRGQPVKIIIENVYLLAKARLPTEFNLADERQREVRLKRRRLDDLQLRQSAALDADSSTDEQNESFLESLATKIVDNLQVTIRNIHFRYEDDDAFTSVPYSVGFTLEELSAVSTDEGWKAGFILGLTSKTHKLLTLKSCCVYWDTESSSIYSDDRDKMLQAFQDLIEVASHDSSTIRYLLEPVSGVGHLTVNKRGSTEEAPHYSMDLFFEQFGLVLDSDQYRDILRTCSRVTWYRKTYKYRKLRPLTQVGESPRKWLQYAFRCVYDEIHERNYKWTWAYFKKRRDQRKEYVVLWEAHLDETETEEQKKRLQEMEDNELEFEDIKFYRELARVEFQKKPQKVETSPKSGGWLSSWWSGNGGDVNAEEDDNLELSDEQRKEFYDAIEFDESKQLADSLDIPRERVKFSIGCNLERGALSIQSRGHDRPVAAVVFEGMHMDLFQRKDSYYVGFKLREIRVEDGSDKTLYRQIVSVKPFDKEEEGAEDDVFFQMSYEHNPLDESADSELLAKMSSMTIFHNPRFLQHVSEFFRPPEEQEDTMGALLNAAESTIHDFTNQTRIGLKYAFDEHRTINCKMDLQAPLIVLPLDCSSWSSPVVVVDAGHISIKSDLADKALVQKVNDESKDQYTESDWQRLTGLLYDKFNLQLQDAQVLIGPEIKSTIEQLHSEGPKPALILDHFTVNLLLEISIVPSYTQLPLFKIGADIPRIKAELNDYKHRVFMKTLEAIMGPPAEPTPVPAATSEAAASSETPALVSSQHRLEVNFSISEIVLSLARCNNPATFEADVLAELVGERFRLHMFNTGTQMQVSVLLAGLYLTDLMETTGRKEFQRLISSQEGQAGDLLTVKYTRSRRLVQFDGEQIEACDQSADIDLSDLRFVVTRNSVLAIVNLARNAVVDPNAPAMPADKLRHNDVDDVSSAPEQFKLHLNMEGVTFVLNDDGYKIATVRLHQAFMDMVMFPEKMKVDMTLGGMEVTDEVGEQGDHRESKLIRIEGDQFAKLHYETFDPSLNKLPYGSVLDFETGSMVVTYVESSVARVYAFLSQFSRMKDIYDRARDAALETSMEYPAGMKFHVLVKAPIFVFPRPATDDSFTVNLGEIDASNRFEVRDDGLHFNLTSASLKNTRLSSCFTAANAEKQALEIVDRFDLAIDVDHYEGDTPIARPATLVTGSVTGGALQVTDWQAEYLLEVVQSVSRAFSECPVNEEQLEDVARDATNANMIIKKTRASKATTSQAVSAPAAEPVLPSKALTLDATFTIPALSLALYNNTRKTASLAGKELSQLALNGLGFKYRRYDGEGYELDIHVKSVVVHDTRKVKENQFTEIFPESNNAEYQLMATVKSTGSCFDVDVAVDSPQLILALDYLFALKSFWQNLSPEAEAEGLPTIEEEDEDVSEEEEAVATSNSYSVTIVNSSILLLADPQKRDTEAVVFKISQAVVTSRLQILALDVSGVGMFLCRMGEDPADNLRIIDDFGAHFKLDSRGSDATSFLTTIETSVDPLLVRVSLRDIKLAVEIFNRAAAQQGPPGPQDSAAAAVRSHSRRTSVSEEIGRTLSLSKYASSVISSASKSSKRPVVLVKAEKFLASIGGLRLVLIGDVHELPVVEMEVKPFEATAKNWSTDLQADATISPLVNIYNYSTSAWEPLLEPWSFAIHVTKITRPRPKLSVNVLSHEAAELTVTSRSIGTLTHFASLIGDSPDIKTRGQDSPYLIVNQTGYDLKLWIDGEDEVTTLKSGAEIPWAFEDWRQVRENLSREGPANTIGLELVDSGYDALNHVSLTREGEHVTMLEPSIGQGEYQFHNRLVCEISLARDRVKHVVLKSTVTLHNDTRTPIVVGVGMLVGHDQTFVVKKELRVAAGEKLAVPISYVYSGKYVVAPGDEQQYGYSTPFDCRSAHHANDWVLECPSSDGSRRYYFRAQRLLSQQDALNRVYPYMEIKISAPLVLQNLLPFDLEWQLFQKGGSKWTGRLKQGEVSAVHAVNMNLSVVMKVLVLGTKYSVSSAAIVNSTAKNTPADRQLTLRSRDGQTLQLGLLYADTETSGLEVSVFAPYMVINRTGLPLFLSDKRNTAELNQTASLFSYDRIGVTDNRVTLRSGDSAWSGKFSIDKVGQLFEVKTAVKGRSLENDIGVAVTEGQGMFKMTKVVELAPRYVVRNRLGEDVVLKCVGASKVNRLGSQSTVPVYGLAKTDPKQIVVGFSESAWSAPFNINEVGELYVRVRSRDGSGSHVLVRVVIAVEKASLFVDLVDAGNRWPFSIRNFSDYDFLVYQSDPTRNKDELPGRFSPIFYSVPAKSMMAYAWDYPAGINKELVLRCGVRERFVQLAEIGTLFPMRLPSSASHHAETPIVDLNVVADGPVQSLVISNYNPSTSMYQLRSAANSSSDGFEATEKDTENYYCSVVVNFEGMGVSLINAACKEFLYLTVKGAELHYNESDVYQNIALKVKWIQADNQMYPAVFPIVMYPTVVPKSRKEMDRHPAFSAGLSRVKDDTHGVTYFKLATVLLQEMSIEIDQEMLETLLDFLTIDASAQQPDLLWDSSLTAPQEAELRTRDDYYFELLHLQPLQFNVSYTRGDDSPEPDDPHHSNDPLSLAVNVLTMTLGNIKDAPIRLSALMLENVRTPLPYLRQNIRQHYRQAFLYQWYKLLGSADVIGNPVGLFNNISSGVMDIFYEPYQGYIMTDSPQELGIGLAKGGLSFLKKSVFGVSDSVSRFTNSIAKGLTAASMDRGFQERRRQNRQKNRPRHPFGGFAAGTSSLLDGIGSGVAGLATAPINGANEEGAAGFFKGIGRGLIGLPTKAATGMLDFANDISEGIKSTTTAFDTSNLDRVRLPRSVSYDGVVAPYSERDAQGQYWLKTCEGGKYSAEKYMAHVVLHGGEHTCIVSMSRILIVSVATLSLDWQVSYDRIHRIVLENTGIRILQMGRNMPERFISLPDKADRRFLYNSIGIAVGEYNKKWGVIP